ncbi:hypothetical protein [Streptomyces sp. DSM 40750]|uniref:hypothetical protein n=1 Tax=Streptomyces sp. DSM 40750 TaxID=2801030 RepID=UPI00214B688A|nr:hypothetical protein [Streptomyces sp. DSM 40750]UUU25591.1 hypothetical protein JIX55_38040 [Streptomyces sp. DSM 40750]
MKRLSAQLVTGLARTAPCDGDDGALDPLCRVLGDLRRPDLLQVAGPIEKVPRRRPVGLT